MTEPTEQQFACSSCGQPQKRASTGSLTQWISTCACEGDYEKQFDKSIKICSKCHRKIDSGRHGSLTQWVFQSDVCDCEKRMTRKIVNKAANSKIKQPKFEGFNEKGEEQELSLSADQFPMERYKPLSILGEGASGTVYLCRDKLLRKKVAVKVLRSVTDDQMVAFQNEARTTSKLDHPSIVQVLDFGIVAETIPYMVMEYLDGITLKKYVRTYGAMGPKEVISIFTKVCGGLANAHESGIFHRDLQSSNLMILPADKGKLNVRIVDFGLAKIKQTTQETTIYNGHTIVGTPLYMSPDQVKGHLYSAASEVYSLGCIMFEALTETAPFVGQTALEILNMHATIEPPSLLDYLDEEPLIIELDRIIQNCLEKEPEDRYGSADELLTQLENLTREFNIQESPRPIKRKTSEAEVFAMPHILANSPDFVPDGEMYGEQRIPINLNFDVFDQGNPPQPDFLDRMLGRTEDLVERGKKIQQVQSRWLRSSVVQDINKGLSVFVTGLVICLVTIIICIALFMAFLAWNGWLATY